MVHAAFKAYSIKEYTLPAGASHANESVVLLRTAYEHKTPVRRYQSHETWPARRTLS